MEQANGRIEGYSDRAQSLIERFGEMTQEISLRQKALNDEIDLRFGASEYDSYKEMQMMREVDDWYQKQHESLLKLKQSKEDYNKAVEKLNIQKLRKLIHVYDVLKRTDVAQDLRDQLQALTKVPEGWRGKVQDVLTQLGLNKGTSFGLWTEDTTQSTKYVDEMIKRYKELKEEIEWVETFDPKQAERLGKEKEAIEQISKALKIDIENLAANKSDKAESKEEKKIKRLVDALRTLQTQYEKLKSLGASSESIKSLFEGLYPELIKENGKEFVTDLNYLERAKKLIERLYKLNPAEAKKLLVDIGEDEFSVFIKNLEKQDKAYKASAKAAGEYFDILRKWDSEDFTIDGEGIIFDISKIVSGLKEQINEIKLRATKARELFNQIDINSEEKIAKVKDIFVKEFGEDAWTEFWTSYVSEGDQAIKTLTDKQIEYEKKLAQEKVSDLAKKYVKETYFTEGINFEDISDKTHRQIRTMRLKLQDILDKEPLSIPVEIQTKLKSAGVDISNLANLDLDAIYVALEQSGTPVDDVTKGVLNLRKQIHSLGITTARFGDDFRDALETDIVKVLIEEMEALKDNVEGASSLANRFGESLMSLGDATNNDFLKGIGRAVVLLGDMASEIAKSDSLMASIKLAFADVSNLSEEAQESLENIASSSDWISVVISAIVSIIEAVANVIERQHQNFILGTEAIVEYKKALADLAREEADTIFGTSAIDTLTISLNEATEAAKRFEKERDNILSQDRGLGGWTLPGIGGESGESFDFTTYRDLQSLLRGKDFRSDKEMMEYLKANIDYWENLSHFADGVRTTSQLEGEIRNLITYYEAWQEAIDKVKDSMTDLFGELGSNIADSMIQNFLEVGNSVANLESSFESLGDTIVKTFLQSAIIDTVLKPKIDEISELTALAASGGIPMEEYARGLEELTGEIKADLASLGPYWDDVMTAFQEAGLMSTTAAGSSLSEGIKGITEDTASLLASYLNAIRADVSYSKTLWMRMDANLQRIAEVFTSSPSLMEYQAQIAANTYDTMVATQNILADLQSVMTYEGGDRAIRILS